MSVNQEILKTIEVLKSGGIILYPTDTIWGIGCDATNPEAVAKVYKLKKREDTKSMLIIVENPGRIQSYVNIMPDIAWDLIEVADKPLTIIYPNAKNLAKNLINADGSIGIRVVNHEFCKRLIQQFGKPIVSTSANISGMAFPKNFNEISKEIKQGVDLIIPKEYESPVSSKPSGIIMLGSKGEIKVIRE